MRSEGGATFLEQDAQAIRSGVGRIESHVESLRILAARSEATLERMRVESELARLRAEQDGLERTLASTRAGCGTLVLVLMGLSMLGPGDTVAVLGVILLVGTLLAYLGGVVRPRRLIRERLVRVQARIVDAEGRLGEQTP